MSNATSAALPEPRSVDQQIVLSNVSWRAYELLDESRGESTTPRMSYLDGTLELMTPSYNHEAIGLMIHDLLRAWADEMEVPLVAAGSWTQKRKSQRAGLEPDQCYALGTQRPKRPDIAVEVIWSSGSLDKLGIYERLRIPEVWLWREGRIGFWVLGRDGYARKRRSALLPDLEPRLLETFVRREDRMQAVRDYRAALRRLRRH